jgi:hypothetical protein
LGVSLRGVKQAKNQATAIKLAFFEFESNDVEEFYFLRAYSRKKRCFSFHPLTALLP